MRIGWLVLLVGCAGGDDLGRALTGRVAPPATTIELADAGRDRDDARVEPPPDAQADAGPHDAAPPVDAAPPTEAPDAHRPVDAAVPDAEVPCGIGEGDRCEVGVGACQARGRFICQRGVLVCDAVAGTPSGEACDGADNDCDGRVDEGVANACGACGLPPDEVCNGIDDDCNGAVDEGLQNACGGCGQVPSEVCDGVDDDCDGVVDEAVCRAWVLLPGADEWTAPEGLNRPFIDGRIVDAAATFFTDSAEVWAFVGDRIHIYKVSEDRWIDDIPLGVLPGVDPPVETAEAVPVWWARRADPNATRAGLMITRGTAYFSLAVDEAMRTADLTEQGSNVDAWSGDPNAPDRPFNLRSAVLDLRNARRFWPGRPRNFCQEGDDQLNHAAAYLNGNRLHVMDVGACFEFVADFSADDWPGFNLGRAPDLARITAWTHIEPEAEGQGIEVIFLR